MLTSLKLGRTWTCDCTNAGGEAFATIDERIAVQHMNAHFRKHESYRMVITRFDDNGSVIVDDVRGATFGTEGRAETFTRADLERAVGPVESKQPRKVHRTYRIVAQIKLQVHPSQREKLQAFDPVKALKVAIEASGFPPVREFRGKARSNKSPESTDDQYEYETVRLVIDDPSVAEKYRSYHPGTVSGKKKRALKIAELLANQPDEFLNRLERAVGIMR